MFLTGAGIANELTVGEVKGNSRRASVLINTMEGHPSIILDHFVTHYLQPQASSLGFAPV